MSERRGIKWIFTINGKTIMKVYRLFFPVLFFAGDTMEHNKMSSLQGGTKGKLHCCMCSTVCKHLDSPNNIPMRKMKMVTKSR